MIDVLVVADTMRRTGVGTLLMNEVERRANRQEMNIFVQTVDDSAHEFFKQRKFLFDTGTGQIVLYQFKNQFSVTIYHVILWLSI